MCIIGLPWASNFFASARTEKADSVPRFSKFFANFMSHPNIFIQLINLFFLYLVFISN